jgi:cell division transport system permease protein
MAAIVVIAVLGWLASRLSGAPEAEQLQALFGAFEIGWSRLCAVMLVAAVVAAIAGTRFALHGAALFARVWLKNP